MNLMVPDVIWEPLERLSDRDFRRVMLAMRAVNEGEEPEALEGAAEIIWMFARRYVEDNRKAYQTMCAQNARNARKRWKMRPHATACDRTNGEDDEMRESAAGSGETGHEADGCDRTRPHATAYDRANGEDDEMRESAAGSGETGHETDECDRMRPHDGDKKVCPTDAEDATGCDRMRPHPNNNNNNNNSNNNNSRAFGSGAGARPRAKKEPVSWNPVAGFKFAAADMEAWRKAAPGLDVQGELDRMHAWLLANPKNRKKNVARFIVNWLVREQGRRGNPAHGGAVPREDAVALEEAAGEGGGGVFNARMELGI